MFKRTTLCSGENALIYSLCKFSIVCDAISTIDGGVTVALNRIDGSVKYTYNRYWDEYSISPNIKSVEAMIMADVADTYIINNIAQFAGGFLNKVDSTHYTLRLMNYKFSMGQDEQLFHLGVNMTPTSACLGLTPLVGTMGNALAYTFPLETV